MHDCNILVILEDDGRRRGAMERHVRKQGLNLSIEFFGTAPDCIRFLDDNLPRVRLVSLDCDLDCPTDAEGNDLPLPADAQSGVEVAAFLASQQTRVPVIIHSANPREPEHMEASLKEAGFSAVRRISPFNDLLWVRGWVHILKELIEAEIAKGHPHTS